MADPTNLPNLEERFQRVRAQMGAHGGGDGHGPSDGGTTEDRVVALEKSVDQIHVKLDKLIETVGEGRLGAEQRFGSIAERLATIEGKLDTKASAVEVARIAGRVETLPTTWQMVTLVVGTVFTILGGAFLILKFGLPHAP